MILPAGTYNISASRAVPSDNGSPPQLFPESNTVKVYDAPIFVEDIMEEMEGESLQSVDNYELVDITISTVIKKDIMSQYMMGTGMMYPLLFGDLALVNPNKNECVLDYIMKETRDPPAGRAKKHVTKQELIECFTNYTADDDINTFIDRVAEKKQWQKTDGVSINMMLHWLQQRASQNINMFAYGPFGELLAQHKTPKTGNEKLNLVFQVNNGHLYPVLDEQKKIEVARVKHLQLSEFKIKVNYEGCGEWGPKSNELDLEDIARPNPPQQVLLVDADDLTHLCMEVTRETKTLITNCEISNGSRTTVTKFEHPITRQIIVAAKDWKIRKAILEKLQLEEKVPYLGYSVFKNQSYGRLGRLKFERNNTNTPTSAYGPGLMSIFAKSTVKPLILWGSEPLPKDAMTIDIRRDYTFIVMVNGDAYPVFATDSVRPFPQEAKFVRGQYYVSKSFSLVQNTVEFPSNWWPMPFVKECIKRGHIDRNDVTHYIAASNFLPVDLFKEHAKEVHAMFPSESKHMIKHHLGWLGKSTSNSCKAAVTDEWDTACAMLNQYPDKLDVHQINGLAFMKMTETTKLTDGHLPIHRQIIAASILNLDDMYCKLVGKDTAVFGYNTDSIRLINPLEFKTGTKPGDWQTGAKPTRVAGYSFYSNVSGWIPTKRMWSDVAVHDLPHKAVRFLVPLVTVRLKNS